MTAGLVAVAAVISGAVVAGSAASLTVRPAAVTTFERTENYAPQLTLLELFDVDTNGRVDRIVATFSESLAAYTAGTAPWTLTNVPSGGALASVAVAGTQATLTITEGAGAADTAVGALTVALVSTATGIRDANGNPSSFTATAPIDRAGPVPVLVATTNAGTLGRIDAGDALLVTFSEAILAASLPATTTVTEADPPGAVNIDTLTVPGVANGTLTTGGNGYITGNGREAGFAASPVSLSAATTVRVQVGPVCAGTGCGTTGADTGAFGYVPAPSLTDAAGNGAGGSYTTAASFGLF
jgi:hypothetical protein